jgi:nitrogen-specific signal transduction histidine kinase
MDGRLQACLFKRGLNPLEASAMLIAMRNQIMKKSRSKHIASPSPQPHDSVSDLASGIANDFNNILTTVMGACSLIDKDDPENDELRHCVALIRSSAEHAADLSHKLAQAGRPDKESEKYDSQKEDSGVVDTSLDKNRNHDIVSTSKHPDGASS